MKSSPRAFAASILDDPRRAAATGLALGIAADIVLHLTGAGWRLLAALTAIAHDLLR